MNAERVSPTRLGNHAHDWKALFSAPTEANSVALRMDWVMLSRSYDVQSSFRCDCGASGARSRGSSGGIVVVQGDEALAAHAALWNLRLCADAEEALLLAAEANAAVITDEEIIEWFEEATA